MQSISLDMVPGGVTPIVRVSQYDKTLRTISIHLTMEGADYAIPSGSTVTVSGTKPDGTGFDNPCSFTGSTVTVSITEQMTAAPGDVPCEITVMDKSGGRMASANFTLRVEEAALKAETVISKSEITLFEKLASETAANAASVKSVATEASAAQTAATNAKASADAAKLSETHAASSEASAKASATTASSAAQTATSKASAAATSATTAQSAQTKAATSETNAAASAKTASDAATTLSNSAAQITQNASDLAAMKKTVSGFGTAATHDVPTGNADVWGKVPMVSSNDGVTELGKYIDFHATKGEDIDYDCRINAYSDGFTLHKKDGTVGTITANLAVTRLSPTITNCTAGDATSFYKVGRMVVCSLNLHVTSAISAKTVLVKGLPAAMSPMTGSICMLNGTGVGTLAKTDGTIVTDGTISTAGWYSGSMVYITAT